MLASAMPSRDKIGRSQGKMENEELIMNNDFLVQSTIGTALFVQWCRANGIGSRVHAPKGQKANSPGQRPGNVYDVNCALKGQKHYNP